MCVCVGGGGGGGGASCVTLGSYANYIRAWVNCVEKVLLSFPLRYIFSLYIYCA